MSLFKVNLTAKNPRDDRTSPPIEVLVDTESELSWLPKDVLNGIGIPSRRKRAFSTGTKQIVQRDVGSAIVRAEGFETIDEVVFAESGDMSFSE